MSEYNLLRALMSAKVPLSSIPDLEHYSCGSHLVWWFRSTRAKHPACIVTSRGHVPMAPLADVFLYEQGVTSQLFRAGTNDIMAGAGAFFDLRIEPQDRTLRV